MHVWDKRLGDAVIAFLFIGAIALAGYVRFRWFGAHGHKVVGALVVSMGLALAGATIWEISRVLSFGFVTSDGSLVSCGGWFGALCDSGDSASVGVGVVPLIASAVLFALAGVKLGLGAKDRRMRPERHRSRPTIQKSNASARIPARAKASRGIRRTSFL